MITLHEVEQLIPFIKVLFDALRSARDFFKSLASKKSSHSKEVMQIDGELQATNTSPYAIRAAGVRLLKPKRVDIVFHMITVQAPRSAMHSAKNLIQAGALVRFFLCLLLRP